MAEDFPMNPQIQKVLGTSGRKKQQQQQEIHLWNHNKTIENLR